MAKISDTVRKQLWGGSGNRCNICKKELIHDTKSNNEVILGQECHITSYRIKGPRFDPTYPKEKLHSYENLILLCAEHHKIVDTDVKTYSTEMLRKIKSDHINWVKEMLTINKSNGPKMKLVHPAEAITLSRIVSGMELVNMGTDCEQSCFECDEPNDDSERQVIKNFASLVEDMEILSDIGLSGRIDYAKYFTDEIMELAKKGFVVYVGVEKAKMFFDNNDVPWRTIYIVIKRVPQ